MEHSVSNCALYWHYLLGVWLLVFGLFTGNNFEILLRISALLNGGDRRLRQCRIHGVEAGFSGL